MDSQTKTLPYIVLNQVSVFPGITTMLEISRKQSIDAVTLAGEMRQVVFIVMKDDIEEEKPGVSAYYRYAVTGRIGSIQKLPSGNLRVMADGTERVRLDIIEGSYAVVVTDNLEMIPDEYEAGYGETAIMRDMLEEKLNALANMLGKSPAALGIRELANESNTPTGVLMNAVVAKISLKPEKRYTFLAKTTFCDRMYFLLGLLEEEIESVKLKNEIIEKTRENIDKNQKNYVLREQIKAIQDELGDGQAQENQELLEKAEKLNAPEEVKEVLRKDIGKLSAQPFGSQEGIVLRNYIEALLEMPWLTVTEENNDLKHASEILEEDHYGLTKVKDRVLEYLAVRNLNGGHESTIICLVGPPGTGKTSIAKSIARALNRKYIRISLGGVHDEAEIRGHRKTYVGAMPGRIAEAIKRAGVSNPLILLDELDKLGADHRGDPASALLEVLDSEQNVAFRDHYLELPIDLSQVIFIATANDASTIPGPLRDRVEMIEVNSYTAKEKEHIANKYLIDKQRKKHGLTEDNLNITEAAVSAIINLYTREAGVRELERKIGEICRKCARRMLEETAESFTVTAENITDYLGKAIFSDRNPVIEDQVGIARGLAWTSVGGDTLEIEVNVLEGKGILTLTGKLGDVMKESAQTALSYVRSIAPEAGITGEYFDRHDIHLHVPEGAVPKDGPSAGITISTAIYSAVTGRKVRGDVAMTGEVTLRGRVLPIGGLREKLLAANQAGMHLVLVPEKNRADVAEIDKEIIGNMEIRFVSDMREVLEAALR